MPTINIPSIGDDPTLEDVIDAFERMRKELEWLLNKNIDTKNARELAGWQIRPDEIVSNDRDVGLSTADDGEDPIRFWAGDAKDGDPNFTVTRAGILTAVAALIMSKLGYPRVEMNSGENIFGVYQTAGDAIKITPVYQSGPPAILFDAATVTQAKLILSPASFGVITSGTTNLNLQSAHDIKLSSNGVLTIDDITAFTGTFEVVSDVNFGSQSLDYTRVTVKKGIITNVSAV